MIRAKYKVRLDNIRKSIRDLCKEKAKDKSETPGLQRKQNELKKQIVEKSNELDMIMSKIEKFYKAKYPNWL